MDQEPTSPRPTFGDAPTSGSPSSVPGSDDARRPGIPPHLPPEPPRPAVVRRYPKPPTIIKHVLLLCFRPEQWAEAARYPLRATIAPALLVILTASLVVGIAAAANLLPAARDLVAHWDERFPPMTLTDGKLSVGEVPAGKTLPRFRMDSNTVIAIDPTDKTTVESIDAPLAIVVGSTDVTWRNSMQDTANREKLGRFLLAFGEEAAKGTFLVDGPHLTSLLQAYSGALAVTAVTIVGFAALLKNLLWAALTAFLIMPLVSLGAPRLAIPRRVAYRIALAVTVPLVAIGAVLEIVGAQPQQLLGSGEAAMILWFLAAGVLAFWAGRLANSMYVPLRKQRRA